MGERLDFGELMRAKLDDFIPFAAVAVAFSLAIEALGLALFIELSVLSLGVCWWVRRL